MRVEVLRCYRNLYRTCQRVFCGDPATLNAARLKLKQEFLKNRSVTDQGELQKLVQEAVEADKFLRECVVQAVATSGDTYRLKIREETVLGPIDTAKSS